MTTLRPLWALLGALAAACVLAGPAAARSSCGQTYAYAGLAAQGPASGVAAMIAPLSAPNVIEGHVAAWVGVGGVGIGPRGSDEWIQVGLAAFPGSMARIYYEVKQPFIPAQYFEVRTSIRPGESHRVAVLRVRGQAAWRVWVDGKPASKAYYLPGSGRGWEPQATAESWNAGRRVCNRYAFAFRGVALARTPSSGWQLFRGGEEYEDPGYRMVRRSAASFLALTRG